MNIKKQFFSLILLILVTTASYASSVIVGHITKITATTIRFSYIENPLNGDEAILEATVDASGEFIFVLHPEAPMVGTLTYNRQEVLVFIAPDQHMFMNFEGSDFLNTIKYEGGEIGRAHV